MTGNAINAKSEALDVHELSSEELDVVSGGFFLSFIQGAGGAAGGKKEADQVKGFEQLLQQLP